LLEEIGRRAFSVTAIDAFLASAHLSRRGSAVVSNSRLRQIRFSENVTVIKQLMFANCVDLRDVVFMNPGTITILTDAFAETGNNFMIHKPPAAKLAGPGVVQVKVDANVGLVIAIEEDLEAPAPAGASLGELLMDRKDRVVVPGFAAPPEGRFGRVYKCIHRVTGRVSAVKEIKSPGKASDEKTETDFMQEVTALQRIAHPAILGLIGYCMPENDKRPQIITEWLPNGNLEALISGPGFATMSGTAKMKIVAGIIMAMRYIHRTKGIHRDLKPANVLLDAKWEVRVADFGKARFTDVRATLTASGGTPLYMAPEFQQGQLTNKVDIFAFGMILWEILQGRSLSTQFAGQYNNEYDLVRKIAGGLRPPTEGLGLRGADFCTNCWDQKPELRPSFDDLFGEMRGEGWQLWPNVDAVEVEKYVIGLENYEEENPPQCRED
jgi:hypothetical protein